MTELNANDLSSGQGLLLACSVWMRFLLSFSEVDGNRYSTLLHVINGSELTSWYAAADWPVLACWAQVALDSRPDEHSCAGC